MKTISVEKVCLHYDIPSSFIDDLQRYELVKIIETEQVRHLAIEDLNSIEKLMRLHYELEVNFEGLDVINNLTDQIRTLHEEMSVLKNQLAFYKG